MSEKYLYYFIYSKLFITPPISTDLHKHDSCDLGMFFDDFDRQHPLQFVERLGEHFVRRVNHWFKRLFLLLLRANRPEKINTKFLYVTYHIEILRKILQITPLHHVNRSFKIYDLENGMFS